MIFLWMDLKYAWRTSWHSPGTTLIIVILLALGTGGVTTIFNPIYSIVFADPPFPQPNRLVVIDESIPLYSNNSNEIVKNITLEYLFSNLATYAISQLVDNATYDNTGEYKKIRYTNVTEDFFGTLGVLPLYGYEFKQSEPGVIISNRFWRNELNGANDVIGKPLYIRSPASSGTTIIGIMPDNFDFPVGTDMWLYHGTGGYVGGTRHFIGRLRPGISMEQASIKLEVTKFESKPVMNLGERNGPILQPFNTVFYGDKQHLLWMLGTISVLFLLLVCSGVMSILVTRGMRRKSEMAMRMALGATRRNLVFQLLRETLPLIIIGTLAGWWLSEIISVWLQVQYPTLKGGEVVVPVKMVFFAAIVLIVSIIGALIPAFYSSSVNLNTSLKSDTYLKRKFFSIHELLIGLQLSLTLALLIAAGLLLRSMMSKVDFPIGWTSQMTLVVDIRLPFEPSLNLFETITRNATFAQEFQNKLEMMPEVAAVGTLDPVPFSTEAARYNQVNIPVFKSRDARNNANPSEIEKYTIPGRASSEVFKMLGIPLVSGRYFTTADIANEFSITRNNLVSGISANTNRVVIINQFLEKRFWPGDSAIGKTIYDSDLVSYEIIGIVKDFYQVADN